MNKFFFIILAIVGGIGFGLWTWNSMEVPVVEDFSQNSKSAGETFTTFVPSEGVGAILVQVELPVEPRYETGAPVIVYVPTFFTPDKEGFGTLSGITEEGFVEITLMYPGRSDGEGQSSEGEDDYGGEDSLQALKDVIRFAHGDLANVDGFYLQELSQVQIDSENLGLFAFSHPGIAATNMLATYGEQLQFVDYFVGRENPTVDTLSCMELGYWEGKRAVENIAYRYPQNYSTSELTLDYSSLWYDMGTGKPYFDLNDNQQLDDDEFSLGQQVPMLFGKAAYSEALIHALLDNGALSEDRWPSDLITPEEASAWWPSRETVENYPTVGEKLPDLKVMLVFAEMDHVQVSADKPHIHQAYDGFTDAGLWVRLNPDASYAEAFGFAFEDHAAGTEPEDWSMVSAWSTQGKPSSQLAPLAAVVEMADRTQTQTWDPDLDAVLSVEGSSAQFSGDTTTEVAVAEEWTLVETPFNGTAYHLTVQNPTTQAALSAYLVFPDKSQIWPTVLFMPGSLSAGTDYVEKNPMVDDLLSKGIAVAYFDPDGRGESTGEEDANGYDQQDGMFAVSQAVANHPNVDAEQLGVVSFSYGVAMTSGMLSRYAEDQPFAWYIDWEGPVAREYVTVGCPETPLAQDALGTSCSDDAFWSEREAVNFLSQLTLPYQRIQGESDHVQSSNEHAIDAINAATAGSSPWTRINEESPNQSFSVSNPPQYIPGKKGSSIRAVTDFIEAMFLEF